MAASKTPTLIAELFELDAQLEALQDRRDEIATDLINRIGIGGTVETPDGKVTVVQNTSMEVDFDTLVSLHPTWARKVTKKVLDRAKFNLLRKADEVPEDVVAIMVEKVSAPFLRLTKR